MLLGRPAVADKEVAGVLIYHCKDNLEARETQARRLVPRVAHHHPRRQIPQLIWELTGWYIRTRREPMVPGTDLSGMRSRETETACPREFCYKTRTG